MLEQTK